MGQKACSEELPSSSVAMPGGLSDKSLKQQYNPNIDPDIDRNVTPM